MNSLVILFSVALSVVSASVVGPAFVVPAENNVLIKGPSSSTNIAGPDGSLISNNADAGAVATSITPGFVVRPQPLPVLLPSPSVVWGSPFPYVYPGFPYFYNRRGAIIDGPSGTIVS